MLRRLLIAIVAIGALASVALCASYGWDQATVLKDRITAAFVYGMVAVFTLVLHVAAIRLWVQGWHKMGVVCGVAGFLAFVMTAFTSLGGLAARSDAFVSERQDALDSKADIKKQIADLTKEKADLKFARTTKAGVDAAQRAVDAARLAREQECRDGGRNVGDNCRKRQDAEANALTALAKTQADKAATDRANEIDAEAKVLRARLSGATTAVGSADPLRALLAVIFGTFADVMTAWQKAVFAVIYDICLLATMIAIEALGHTPAPVAVRAMAARPEPEDSRDMEPASIEPPPRPKLVASNSARPAGSIPKILAAAMEPGKGSRIEMEEIYAAYAGECDRLSAPAVSPQDFVEPLKRFCSTCRIKTKVVDGKVYLLNVRLVPLMTTREEGA